MFAQIAQTMALPKGKGWDAVKASVEVLARENVSMLDIYLNRANLSGADFRSKQRLLQDRLDEACADLDDPPQMPTSLT